MGWPKGKPRGAKPEGSGRKIGTPNKGVSELMAKCEAMGVDPWEKLIEFLVFPGEPQIRLQALKEICQYLYPKRKSLEHSGELNNTYLELPLDELESLVKQKLKKK